MALSACLPGFIKFITSNKISELHPADFVLSSQQSLSWSKNLLTYSTVQSLSWKANWFAASQEIPRISRNPKVHYRTHKSPQPVSILCQPNPVNIPTWSRNSPSFYQPEGSLSGNTKPVRSLLLYLHRLSTVLLHLQRSGWVLCQMVSIKCYNKIVWIRKTN